MAASDSLPRRGRPSRGLGIAFEVERELTALDLTTLASAPREEAPRQSPAPPLQRITARHHHTARLVAAGVPAVEVALVVGLTAQRVRDLQLDPAFQELVAYYFSQKTEADIADEQRFQARLKHLAESAMIELDERLEDPAKRARIPVGELRQIAALGADRTVAPPKQAQGATVIPTQITFNIAGRGLTGQAPAPAQVIDHKPEGESEC